MFPACIVPLSMMGQWVLLSRDYRRRRRVVRNPATIPTDIGNIPAVFRDRLGRLTHALRALGFEAAANGHACFAPDTNWTQVVFVRRDTWDRVSIFCIHDIPRRKASLNYGFATDATDGMSVKTLVGSENNPRAQYRATGDLTSPETVAAAYATHCQRVQEELGDRPRAPLPPPGNEMAWLSERVAKVTANIAKSNGLVPVGIWYLPSWTHALRATWVKIFPISLLVKKRPPGFEVLPSDATR